MKIHRTDPRGVPISSTGRRVPLDSPEARVIADEINAALADQDQQTKHRNQLDAIVYTMLSRASLTEWKWTLGALGKHTQIPGESLRVLLGELVAAGRIVVTAYHGKTNRAREWKALREPLCPRCLTNKARPTGYALAFWGECAECQEATQ